MASVVSYLAYLVLGMQSIFFYLYSLTQSPSQHSGEGRGQGVDVIVDIKKERREALKVLGHQSWAIWYSLVTGAKSLLLFEPHVHNGSQTISPRTPWG